MIGRRILEHLEYPVMNGRTILEHFEYPVMNGRAILEHFEYPMSNGRTILQEAMRRRNAYFPLDKIQLSKLTFFCCSCAKQIEPTNVLYPSFIEPEMSV
jgi:hypothetical protein